MLRLIAVVAIVLGGVATADAAPKRFPKPPPCPDGGPWQGTFSGTYEAGMFRDSFYTFYGQGCFRTKAACDRWIYDVRSVTLFHQERVVRCERRG